MSDETPDKSERPDADMSETEVAKPEGVAAPEAPDQPAALSEDSTSVLEEAQDRVDDLVAVPDAPDDKDEASETANEPEAPVLPEGTVDLTEEAPQIAAPQETEDSIRIPASLYRNETIIKEPVPGTVEVDKPVAQPNETVIMPVESAFDDHRAARARALGEVDPGADVIAAPQKFAPPSVYRAWPSFTLFILRLVIAAILSIRATQQLLNFTDTKKMWMNSVLPQPELMATLLIVLQYVIALMLLLGLASRVAGLMMMVVFITVLGFLVWGAVNPFQAGVIGFSGEFEVLMVVIGLVFAGIGGGTAAVDGAVHRARIERKNAKIV